MSAIVTHRPAWFLALLATAALFTLLGSRGLNEPDEGRYAEIAREMTVTGEWLVPHLNGFEHFQKPPLLYWMTAAAIRLFGVNEWAARLPSALAGLGTVLLTFALGSQLYDRRTGFIAGLILLSSAGFFFLARLLTPDMLLTFWVTAAITCFVKFSGQEGSKGWGYLFFVALGCGFLTKGPMALVVPISAVIAWHLTARKRGISSPLPWVMGLMITLFIGLAWFVALSLWRHELFTYFWRYELVERFASSHHGRSHPFWFFIPVILIALIPWVFLLPGTLIQAWQRLRRGEVSLSGWLLLGWWLPPFLILSISGSKLPTYILPLLPSLAIAFARYSTREGHNGGSLIPRITTITLLFLLAAVAALPSFNDLLGQQASVRELIAPGGGVAIPAHARVYAIEVRCHGLEFYLRRLVSVSREQADLVLPPTPAQEQRLISLKHFKSQDIEPAVGEDAVFVIVRARRAEAAFPHDKWVEVASSGDFRLLKSTAERNRP